MKVKVSNPLLSGEERTYLASDYSSGTTLTVRNSDGFSDNWYVVVGEPGQERTELKDINGAPGSTTTITIGSALSFSHAKATPVYESQWDRISFERKPSAGSFSEISGSPFAIEWDNHDNKTMIIVSGGASTDTYRWRFYSSQQGNYSAYSDELPGTGVARNKLGYVISQVRRNPIVTGIKDEILVNYANDFQALVYEQLPKAWWFVKEGTALATTANTYRYNISDNFSDFVSMKFMLYRYISGSVDNTYPLSYVPLQEFYNYKADANQTSSDTVRNWTLLPPDSSSAKGYIGLHPTPATTACRLKPVYQFTLTDLDSFGDSLVIPEAKGYIDYILYRVFDDIKSDKSNADKYNLRVLNSVNGLKKRGLRQMGQAELFRFRGTSGWSRQYGEGGFILSGNYRELYW